MSEIKELYKHYLKCNRVSTDTRSIENGDLFVALKGPSFDGNNYAKEALEKGARYALVDEPNLPENPGFFFTEDCLTTLQQLAAYRRSQLNIPVLGITGSNGKTTTKELLVAVLSTRFIVSATAGNFNNHIGVPLTILNAQRDADILIVEMGTNQPGDIQQLCDIADPNFGLITNIGSSHLERLGSIEGVFKDKKALYHHVVSQEGIFFLNTGDSFLATLPYEPRQTLNYSSDKGSFGQLEELSKRKNAHYLSLSLTDEEDKKELHTFLYGVYNVENIAAVLEVGTHFDVPPQAMIDAISSYRPDNMRSQVIQGSRNSVILDAYNANPSSMKMSILSLMNKLDAGECFLILGDMLELGEHAKSEHEKIIELLNQHELKDRVVLVGDLFDSINNKEYKSFKNTNQLLKSQLLKGLMRQTVLVKGSRGIRLEKVVSQL